MAAPDFQQEVRSIFFEFVKNDALLALGILMIGMGVNLFSIGQYLFSALFLFMSFGVLFLRSMRKVERHIGKENLDVTKTISVTKIEE